MEEHKFPTVFFTLSSSCPRDLYVHRAISIPTCLFTNRDTVMAVATDSHRYFLIPERTAARPTTNISIQMLCVYSFVQYIISYLSAFFNPFLKKRYNIKRHLCSHKCLLLYDFLARLKYLIMKSSNTVPTIGNIAVTSIPTFIPIWSGASPKLLPKVCANEDTDTRSTTIPKS